jgi:serine/threonine-protein kinase
MTPELWQRIKAVFDAALQFPPSERAKFLDTACGADASLRAEVESLLAAGDTEGFLDTPMPDSYSRLRTSLADRYRLERELGRGGMATVFLAHDLKHDRPVALKVLHPELATALGPERFQREIMLAARLQHPHILTVLDSGEAAGQLWFTMPFVEGESLRDRLNREKQLPLEDALRVAREAAEALDYAHRHGVVHRDVKPDNILLTESHALVADFGIARALGGTQDPLTSSGVAIGTPAYMSPEQASGTQEVDARTDVYALGCVLYEMLAGEPPYTGPTPQAIIARALTESPRSIHPVRAGVPEAVDAVIAKAMAPVMADRYSSAAEFARALQPSRGDALEVRQSRILQPLAARPLFAALTLGILIGGGALFAWRLSSRESDQRTLVAVLPFENLGAPEEEYIADGITDEVRSRLRTLPGVEVIARGSSIQYKKTTLTQRQIAQELGARYLLTATVRWEKVAGGRSRVRVSPEFVEVANHGSPTIKWQQQFDASLTDQFQVYADISSRVAQSLRVALGGNAQRLLAARPTEDGGAYDAFLRGEVASQGMSTTDLPSLRRAVEAYGHAVALDSSFLEAWAQLARAQAILYYLSTRTPAGAEAARRSATHALALAPERPEAHRAMSAYYANVLVDIDRALAEDSTALVLGGVTSDLLVAISRKEMARARWDAALAHLEQANRLDPRSVLTAQRLCATLLWLRRYPKALEACNRALALDPTNLGTIDLKTAALLGQGDLAGARAALATSKDVDPTRLVADLAGADLFWVLNESQRAMVLTLPPSAFDDDRGHWALVMTEIYAFEGDVTRALLHAELARRAFEDQLRTASGVASLHASLGLALAYLGRKTEAIRQGEIAVSLLPMDKDVVQAVALQNQLIRILLLTGEPEKALDRLAPLLKMPSYLSPGRLRIDPTFDPVRSNPRFQRLITGK